MRYVVEIKGSKGWEIHFEADNFIDAVEEAEDIDDHESEWRLTCEQAS